MHCVEPNGLEAAISLGKAHPLPRVTLGLCVSSLEPRVLAACTGLSHSGRFSVIILSQQEMAFGVVLIVVVQKYPSGAVGRWE